MKVLLVNGSTRKHGCTFVALEQVAKALEEEGIETEIIELGPVPIRDCTACGGCRTQGKCVFNDDLVNEFIEKAKVADGFVFGSPVYYAHPTGQIQSFMDRVFYAGGASLRHKPAAVVASARRAGNVVTTDALQKHLSINQMPIITSSYWNIVFGSRPEEVLQDKEGLQTMKNLGKNMAYILKVIEAGKEKGITSPENETKVKTNFIR